MKVEPVSQHQVAFHCDDGATLDRVKDICDGIKQRGVGIVIMPTLSLPKLARIFPRGWQNLMGPELRQRLLEISEGVKTRRLLLEQYRQEYRGDGDVVFDYEVKSKYKPLRHQLTMAKCVATLPKCGLLADPGTCKTAAYLWGLHHRILHGTVKRALVITLSHLKENVLEEMGVVAPDLKGVALGGRADADRIINKKYKLAKKNLDYDIYICNYESMFGVVEIIPEGFFDAVVLDEAHRVGSASSRQTQSIVGKFENVPYKYIVTGTLVANNELSFFMPFRFMGPDTVPEADFACFRSKHFYTVDPDRRVWVAEGVTKDLVRDQITKNAVCFRKEHCVDLPGVVYTGLAYDLCGRQLEAYNTAKKELIYTISKGCSECQTKDKCVECPNTLLIKNALVCVNKLAQITCGFFIETRVKYDEKGKEKPDNVVHWLEENPKLDLLVSTLNNIPCDRKVIVWSNFTAGIKLLRDRIGLAFGNDSFIAVYGDVDAYAAVNRFKNEPGLRFMIANQAKAGTGLNIQFSNYQAFFMNDYSYVKRDQTIARQDRQGQTEKVQVIDFCGRVYKGWAVDHEILCVLNDKKNLATSLTNLAVAAGLDKNQYGADVVAPKEIDGTRELVADKDSERPPWD